MFLKGSMKLHCNVQRGVEEDLNAQGGGEEGLNVHRGGRGSQCLK